MTNEKLIEKYMRNGKYTREQAIELIEYDKAIDRGEKTEFDLTDEQKKNQKKVRNTLGTGKVKESPINKVKKPRVRKADMTKQEIINSIYELLKLQYGESVKVVNKEKLISFEIEGENYEIDLKKKRKPKA